MVLAVTKKVTVLIFALFCPRGLESAVNQVPGKAFRGSKDTKWGRRLSCAPFSGVIRSLCQNLCRFVELRVVQIGVEAALGEQLVVCALLDDVAVANHQDHVGVSDRGQAVRDDKARAALH